MSKAARMTLAFSVAAILGGLPLFAMAQQPEPPRKPAAPAARPQPPHPQGQPVHPGQPPHAGVVPPGPVPAAQFHQAGPPGQVRGVGPGPGQVHAVHAIGERGYSFRSAYPGRRDVATFNERERAVWYGGRWRHERHFGRLGYWWEVNGVWYYYDQPFAGPPGFVSEVEFLDDGYDPYAPVVVGQPAPVMVQPAPVYVQPAPPVVYVAPPPLVCVGPLCVR